MLTESVLAAASGLYIFYTFHNQHTVNTAQIQTSAGDGK